jgi:hypothetical protein
MRVGRAIAISVCAALLGACAHEPPQSAVAALPVAAAPPAASATPGSVAADYLAGPVEY